MEVYLITNTVNGKKYVGQSAKTSAYRWKQHLWASRRDDGYALHNAIRKYGEKSFLIEVLFKVSSKEEMDRLECDSIYLYSSHDPKHGYNLTKGGDGTFGYRHTDSTKQVLSSIKKGISHSPETRARMIASQKKSYSPGDRVNFMTVISEAGRDPRGKVLWLCQCDCGNTKVMRGDQMKNGNSRSCGCLQREAVRKLMTERNPRTKSGKTIGEHIIPQLAEAININPALMLSNGMN